MGGRLRVLAIRKRRSDRPGKDQDRASKDSTPRPEAGGSSSGFAGRGRDAAARADLERRLRANEETLHGLIEASNQGLLIVTREHEPLLANWACAEIFGFDSAEAITALDSTAGLFPPLGLARLEAIDKENLNGRGAPDAFELDGIRRDGALLRLQCTAKPIDWQGRRAVLLTLLEITGHEKAEAALSEREAGPPLSISETVHRGSVRMAGSRHAARADARKSKDELIEEIESLRRRLGESERMEEGERKGLLDPLTERLQQVFREAPTGLCYFDRNLRYVFINNFLAGLNGISVEEHLGRSIREVFPEVAVGVESQLRHVIETGEPIIGGEVDAETQASPGLIRSFQHNYVPVTSDDGTVKGVSCVVEEITERKKAEAALRESEARLQAIMDHSPAEIFLVDTDCRYVFVNREFERRYDVTVEEVKGKTIYDFFPANIADEFSAQDREVLETRKVMIKEQQLWYGGRLHTDLEIKFPIVGSQGEVVGLGGIATDITERKCAEEALQKSRDELEFRVEERTSELREANEALRDSEEQTRLLLESTAEAIHGLDFDGIVTFCNRACVEMLGYDSPDDLLGRHMHDLIHHTRPDGSPYPAKECLIYRAYERGERVHVDSELLWRADGTSFDAEIWSHPIWQGDRCIGSVVTFLDITERKRAEGALRDLSARLISAQEEERSRIARELHDDFNQRLALLAVDIERLVGQTSASRDEFDVCLKTLVQRICELSSDIHRLSHQLHPSILEHLGLVAAIRSYCKELSDLHGVHIELAHHGASRALPKNVALCLYRVVQEALRNVIKHSGAESARVEITEAADGLRLEISDSGTGFDPGSARTRGGLGLLSMRERLRLVSGTISFERLEPNGTRIHVRVPLPVSDDR